MEKYKTLRVRCYLKCGVISDEFLPLDGILYYHKVRSVLGAEILSKSKESTVREGKGIKLPFKKGGGTNERWYYNCSFAQFPINITEKASFKVKSSDWLRHSSFFDGKKKIDQKRGKFKSGHLKFFYRHAEYIDWYCVGLESQIAELLNYSTHVGKNTGDGWGEVLRWEIKEWPENWSIKNDRGELMRAVPVFNEQRILDKGGKIPSTVYGIRPSYWNPRHIFPCFMPKRK